MRKILMIEDNKDISSFLKKNLVKDGFLVDIVETGYAVLAYLKDSKEPDAVILDLFLPERSGIELLDSLVNHWKKAKIFIYSGRLEWKARLLKHPSVYGFFNKTDGQKGLIDAIKKECGDNESL